MKIRNEHRKSTMDIIAINRIIREYSDQLDSNKLKNPDEIDIFLEKYALATCLRKDIKCEPTYPNKNSKPPNKKTEGPHGFTGQFYPSLHKKNNSNTFQIFQKTGKNCFKCVL